MNQKGANVSVITIVIPVFSIIGAADWVIVGKLISGVYAVLLALLIYKEEPKPNI